MMRTEGRTPSLEAPPHALAMASNSSAVGSGSVATKRFTTTDPENVLTTTWRGFGMG